MNNFGSYIVILITNAHFIINMSSIVDTPSLEELYIASLDEMDKIALNVARTTMGSLFSLSKSTAFVEWTNERNKKQMDA